MYKWEMSRVFQIVWSALIEEHDKSRDLFQAMFYRNVLDEPSRRIAAFLGVPFTSSGNAISGVSANITSTIGMIRVHLWRHFESQCRHFSLPDLPMPLNESCRTMVSMATSMWLGWLRVPGEPFAYLGSKCCKPLRKDGKMNHVWKECCKPLPKMEEPARDQSSSLVSSDDWPWAPLPLRRVPVQAHTFVGRGLAKSRKPC